MGFFKSLLNKNKDVSLHIKPDYQSPPVTVLYGTKTGNSQLIAQQTHKYFKQCGLESECYNMDKYDVGRLPSEKNLLIVISTDGEGELPPNAQKFFRLLQHEAMPHLSNLNYAICALGDSNYDNFCGAGKLIDKEFHLLNAKPIINRVDCDLDFKKAALQWIQDSYDTIVGIKKEPSTADKIELSVPDFLTTKLLKRYKLSKGNTEQAVYHIELDNTKLQVNYSAGDCIEIIPTNPKQLVDKLLTIHKFDKNYFLKEYNQTLENALLHRFELTKLARPVIRRYLSIFKIDQLEQVYSKRSELKTYLEKSDVLDLLSDYPTSINEDQLISILQPLHSRYYSIASGYKANPDKIDLTIKTVRFNHQQRQYEGAGSIYMTEGLNEATSIDFRITTNPSFHLPENKNTPVIFIGVGTGIAPYRAFLQDLQAQNIKDKAWLIWGDKHQADDFLYEDELLNYKQNNTLAYLNAIFSRDQEEKIYVHHCLIENKTQLFEWLDNGAHIYLCGHNAMGNDVKNTLLELFQSEKGMTTDEAKRHLKELNIIHEDLY